MLWKCLTIMFFVMTIHFSVLLFTRRPSKKYINTDIDENDDRIKLIIDTDAGGDDAVAISLALAAKEKVQVVAITCVYGNTNETNVETNVLKILTIAKRDDIPVYAGVKKPLVESYEAGDYFGKDGMGDFDFGRPIKSTIDRSTHAAIALIEIIKTYPGEISILTLGPLTNVALAASLDTNFTQNVKKFYIMGSTINATNMDYPRKGVEFNFAHDPESDDIFLKSITREKSLVAPYDVVVKNFIPMSWRINNLGKLNSETIDFLNKCEAKILFSNEQWISADTVAVAAMIWPDIVTLSFEAHMSAVTCDDKLKGAVVLNYSNPLKNVDIIRDFNVIAFQNKLLQYLA